MKALFVDIVVAMVGLAIFIGIFKIWENFRWKKKKTAKKNEGGDEKEIQEVDHGLDYKRKLVSVMIQMLVLLLVFVTFSFNGWLFFGMLLFFSWTLYMSIFKVKNVKVASPSSLFTGRFKAKPDELGFSVPIAKPYKEGLHYKPFWWTIDVFSRKTLQLVIDRQEYQIGSGGSIVISGLVQYRISDITTYRASEIGEKEVKAGLGSEVDQFIIKWLGMTDHTSPDMIKGEKTVDLDTGMDEVIQTRAQLSEKLEARFKSKELEVEGRKISRKLFGKVISYAEHGYGAEVLTARIDKVDPVEGIKQERDKIQKERYQVRSESIQLQHFLNRVNEAMDNFEKKGTPITVEKAVEMVQISMGLTSKQIQEFQVGGAEGLVQFVTDWLGKKNQPTAKGGAK